MYFAIELTFVESKWFKGNTDTNKLWRERTQNCTAQIFTCLWDISEYSYYQSIFSVASGKTNVSTQGEIILTSFSVDHTRIILRDGDQSQIGSDYINANLITVCLQCSQKIIYFINANLMMVCLQYSQKIIDFINANLITVFL